MGVCIYGNKNIFFFTRLGNMGDIIWHKALDLRPIICKAGVVIRDAQEENVLIVPWRWARRMWEKWAWIPLICECPWKWNEVCCSVEAMNIPVEVVMSLSAFPSDIRPGRGLWDLTCWMSMREETLSCRRVDTFKSRGEGGLVSCLTMDLNSQGNNLTVYLHCLKRG